MTLALFALLFIVYAIAEEVTKYIKRRRELRKQAKEWDEMRWRRYHRWIY